MYRPWQGSRIRAAGAVSCGSSDRAHQLRRRDLADGVVIGVRHIQVVRRVSRDASRNTERCSGARSVRTATCLSGPGKGAHYPGRGDPAYRVVTGGRDIQIAGRIYRDAVRITEQRGGAARSSGPGKSAYYAGRGDLADHVIPGVRHIQVARRVSRDADRITER